MRFLLFYRINEACAGSSGSPDVHPVGRREIHTVSLCDSIEVLELVILLEGAVDAQVRQRMDIVDAQIDSLQGFLVHSEIRVGSEKRVVIKILPFRSYAQRHLDARHDTYREQHCHRQQKAESLIHS